MIDVNEKLALTIPFALNYFSSSLHTLDRKINFTLAAFVFPLADKYGSKFEKAELKITVLPSFCDH